MSFGITVYNSSEDAKWGTDLILKPILDIWVYAFPESDTKNYPDAVGSTISVQVSPTNVTVSITYPAGVPTVTISSASDQWWSIIYIFIETWPSALEAQSSYRILNEDGTHAITPELLAVPMEYIETKSTSTAATKGDYCDIVAEQLACDASYSVTVTKASWPDPPFVMVDLPTHPYFAGIMDIKDDWGESSDWTIRISGNFSAAPDVYLFRRRTAAITDPSSGFGLTFYDSAGDCIINATADTLLGFSGVAENPPIDNFNVPADGDTTFTIGNLDQSWTPTADLPTNALIWVPAKQISAMEECLEGGKFLGNRIIKEWISGMCRYNDTQLMLRLHQIVNLTYSGGGIPTTYANDIQGGDYTGVYLIADKDRVIP